MKKPTAAKSFIKNLFNNLLSTDNSEFLNKFVQIP